MFDSLAHAVDEVDVPLSPEALRELSNICGRLQAKLALAVGAYEAAGLHEIDGSLVMRHLAATARSTCRARSAGAASCGGPAAPTSTPRSRPPFGSPTAATAS